MKKKACFLPGGTQPKKTNYEGFRRNEVFLVANAVTAAEMLEFGEAYADQIIKNAKVLAKALSEKGLGVLCPKKGFTESHQVVVDSRDNGGSDAAGRILERAGIIVTKVPLPNDRGALNGLRIGTEEVTRLGMKTKDMEQAAEFFEKVLVKKEDPVIVSKEVAKFREDFQNLHFCFDHGTDAYKYFEMSSVGL